MTTSDPLTMMSCLLQKPELLRMAKDCIARRKCLSTVSQTYLGTPRKQSSSCPSSNGQVVPKQWWNTSSVGPVSSYICQRKRALSPFCLQACHTITHWSCG
ncbi:hypothetical protein MC885_017217 [Smutsia gigantea]|nr:hypothetical protein MC885_017217 [Smutsia gigantea]